MNKNKEFIKEVKIDKKRRFRYNLITLIIFNILFLCSLIYMYVMLNNVITGVVSVLLFAFTVFLSVRTLFNSINARKYVIYRDKITIESTTFNGEIDLSKVFMVKSKRNLIDVLFKNDAHTIVIHVKNKFKEFYMLTFIGEDTNLLVDEILKLAIQAREINSKTNQNILQTNKEVVEDLQQEKNESEKK